MIKMINGTTLRSPPSSESDMTMSTITAACSTVPSRNLRLLDVLQHATYCLATEMSCLYNPSCHQMKQLLQHTSSCMDSGSCVICKDIHVLLTEHAQECLDKNCRVYKCHELRKEILAMKTLHERLFTSYNALFASNETATTICAAKLSPPTPTRRVGPFSESNFQLKLPTYHGEESRHDFPPHGVSLMHSSFYDSDTCSSRGGESPRKDNTDISSSNHCDSSLIVDDNLILLPSRPVINVPNSIIEEKDIVAQNKLKKKNAKKALKKMTAGMTNKTSIRAPAAADCFSGSLSKSRATTTVSSSVPPPRQLQRVRSFSEFSDSSNDGGNIVSSPSGRISNLLNENSQQPRIKLARSYSTCSESSCASEVSCGHSSVCPSSISCYDDEADNIDFQAEIGDLSLLDLKIANAPTNYEDAFLFSRPEMRYHELSTVTTASHFEASDLYISHGSCAQLVNSGMTLNYSNNDPSRAMLPDFSIPPGERLETTDTDRLFTLFDEDDELFQYLDREEDALNIM